MRFPSVLCIGAAAIDRIATTEARPARLSTSNPGRIRAYPGGAARNMAEALARLGVPASLAAMIGADSDGDAILASLRGTGVDVTSVQRSSVHATPGYLAIHDGGGDIVLGVADMVAAETAPAALVLDALARLPDALVLADANLGTPALETLARSGRRLAACAISVEKSQRLRPLLGHIETLFLNR
ncbi:MAG TPA: PfkB family carbohydrate kinase, partial [Beijerinckiaceae bacterium]|nr:PfkB family carbohydrate kinase [Beijerinckiaceae bacterium]